MTEKEIKRHLEDRGLKVSDVVRAVQEANPTLSERYLDTAIRNLIAGRQWLPVYAKFLEATFGIVVDRPVWAQNVRERMRLAA
jgi:hypothetical protein